MGAYRGWLTASVACALLGLAAIALAEESPPKGDETIGARLGAVEELVARQQEVITQQARQIEELRAGKPEAGALSQLEKQAREKKEAVELPTWLEGLKFSGDLRLRYEGLFYDDSTKDVNHGRFRLRFGIEKQVTDELLAAFRLASGSSNDPTSTNQSFTDDFSKKSVWIDLAYVLYKPAAVNGLAVGAGKLKNPFINTDLVWDSDVNPEGAFATYTWKATDTFKPFVTVGGFLVDDNTDTEDANLAALQGGWEWTVHDGVVWTFAAAYYDWINVEEPGNFLAARGNTTSGGMLTAGDFDVLNVTNFVGFNVSGVPVKLYFDFARNLGDSAPAPDDGLDTANAAGFALGKSKDKGDWQFDYKYAHIQPNAVVGSFNDADFGSANRKGHVIGVNYMLHKNVAARLTTYLTEPERGSGPEKTTIHADLVFKL